jgi:DNA-3-methyladenine glycosylase I
LSEKQKLKQIFTSIYSKVRNIQINNNFDKAVEREASKTYIGMNDDYFFKQMCDLIFQSGLRGQVWQRYESEIRKEFREYKVKKVAEFSQKDVERMLHNPKMLKHRKKIEAVINNAKEIVAISKENDGFWKFLDSHNTEELVEKMKSSFKWMGYTNAYALLRYVGMECIKPDLNVVRVLFRLGLIDSNKKNLATYKQIQVVGKKMAKVNKVRMAVVDFTFYMYGSGEKPFVKYAVCGKVPRCDECSVEEFCQKQ